MCWLRLCWQTEDALIKSLGLDDGVRAARRLVRLEADAERQELASRIRARMREEKLANAKLMKASLPNVQGKLGNTAFEHKLLPLSGK